MSEMTNAVRKGISRCWKLAVVVGAACFALTSFGSLPEGYARADWIQGDGSTSDVSLDFIPNPQTDKVVIELEMTDLSRNMFAFSARKGSKVASWSLNLLGNASSDKRGLRLDYAKTETISYKTSLTTGTVYTYTLDRNKLTCSHFNSLTATADSSFVSAGGNLHLFCTPGNTTSVGNFKLYSFKIYREDVLIHDLVPALDGSGKPQLVDIEGELAITMSGTFTASVEQHLADEVKALYEQVNPLVGTKRKFISLAYITDTHKCKRVSGDADATNPVTDYWYHDESGNPRLVDPEPSIRLLGKVAETASFDALIHAGDFSTAITAVPFEEGDYFNEIRNVKTMVSTHLPSTPFFAVDGNHDRNYWNAGHTSGHTMSDSEWAAALAEINTDVSGNSEIDRTALTGNSYALDFKRCLSAGKNIRLVMASIYDANGGSNPAGRLNEGFVFPDAEINEFNTIVGVTAHDYKEGFGTAAKSYLTKNVGVGFFGAITGHRHKAVTEVIAGTETDHVVVKNAFSVFGDETRAVYRFSIFVFDTEANKMHEIRLSGDGLNAPQLLEHPIAVSVSDEKTDHELLAIGGDGTAYFETDFTPNPQTDKIVIELLLPEVQDSVFAFCARTTDAKESWSLNLRSGGYRFDYKNNGTPTGTLERDVRYTFTVENNVLTWSGGEGTVAKKDETFVQAGGPLCLFHPINGTLQSSKMRLYSFKIYRSGQLIHDLQPYYSATSGATLIDKVTGGDPITLTKKGGEFFPIETDPCPPRGATKLEWIQCDGSTGYFTTDFIPDPSTDKIVAELTLMDKTKNQFLFSARGLIPDGSSFTTSDAWSLLLRCADSPKKIRYDYKDNGTAVNCSYSEGERVSFTADRRVLTWPGINSITSSKALFGPAGGFLWLLGADGGSKNGLSNPSSVRLHSFCVWRDNVLIHEFLPTLLPSGEATLMDFAKHPAVLVKHGSVIGGPELPKKGLIVIFK